MRTRAVRCSFKPEQSTLDVHPGEVMTVMYEVSNEQARTVQAQAIPSYAPKQATEYFKKIECFCFTQQTLKPNRDEADAGGVRGRPEAAEGRENDHVVVHVL